MCIIYDQLERKKGDVKEHLLSLMFFFFVFTPLSVALKHLIEMDLSGLYVTDLHKIGVEGTCENASNMHCFLIITTIFIANYITDNNMSEK